MTRSPNSPDGGLAPNAHRFGPMPDDRLAIWSRFPAWDRVYFPSHLGLVVEELRLDYARMRLPYRPEYEQPAGVLHGGAIATLIDTVVVPAVGSGYDGPVDMLTLSMTVNYLGAVKEEDAVAEGWVELRGRRTLFCRVEVRAAGDARLVATGTLVYTARLRG